MIKLGAFGLSTNPTTDLIVEDNKSIKQIAMDQGITINTDIVTHNGSPLAPALLLKPISELGVEDGDLIFITVKRDGANN